MFKNHQKLSHFFFHFMIHNYGFCLIKHKVSCLLDYDIVITTFIDRKALMQSCMIKRKGRKRRHRETKYFKYITRQSMSKSKNVLKFRFSAQKGLSSSSSSSCILHQVSKVELIMMDLADALRQMLLVHSKCIAKLISKIEFYVNHHNVRKSLKKSHIQIFSMNHFWHKNKSI